MDKLTRRNIRYICFRLKSEAQGGVKAVGDGIMEHVEEVKEHMSEQADFGGWDKFGVTWDVDEKAYLVVVTLRRSHESAWNKVIARKAKDLPSAITDELPKEEPKKEEPKKKSWQTKFRSTQPTKSSK
ncbi:MAG: hypothetical protein WD874_01710 [Parcubacteria group bacterium]